MLAGMPRRYLEYMPLDELKRALRNPKGHDAAGIRASIERHGVIENVVLDERTGRLVGGHGRVEGFVEMQRAGAPVPDGVEVDEKGRWLVGVQRGWSSKDDEDAELALIALNRLVEAGGWDERGVAEILGPVVERRGEAVLLGTGYEPATVRELLARATDRPKPRSEPDDAPPAPLEPRSQPGDIYLLADSLLVCGDCTDPDVVDAAVSIVGRPDLVFTDPPYGMSYSSGRFDVIEGDDLRGEKLTALLVASLGNAQRVRTEHAAMYVCLTWRTYAPFLSALVQLGLEPAALIVWDKGRIGLGNADYRPAHEFVFYVEPFHGYDADHEMVMYLPGEWNGDRSQGDVWRFPRDAGATYVHPTQKPVALVRRAIENSSRPSQVVLDCFAGSGSTLIACWATRRRAILIEKDPVYADVIARRFEEHTGIVPLLASGEPRSFVASEEQSLAKVPNPS